MDSKTDMLKHAAIIGVVAFFIDDWRNDGGTPADMLKYAAIIGVVAFLYMGAFGHGLPTKLRGPFFR
jgi:hypothetical protein